MHDLHREGSWEETERREGAADSTLVRSPRGSPSCEEATFHNARMFYCRGKCSSNGLCAPCNGQKPKNRAVVFAQAKMLKECLCLKVS